MSQRYEGRNLEEALSAASETLGVERWQECRAQGEPEVDRLLLRLALGRQMLQGMQRLVEIPHSLMVSRARHGSFPGLSEIRQSFIPDLPT